MNDYDGPLSGSLLLGITSRGIREHEHITLMRNCTLNVIRRQFTYTIVLYSFYIYPRISKQTKMEGSARLPSENEPQLEGARSKKPLRRGRMPGKVIRESFVRLKKGRPRQPPSGQGRSLSPNRGGVGSPPYGRGRSISPSRVVVRPPPGRGRSASPSRFAGSPSGHGRSVSPSRGHVVSPPGRGRSVSPHRAAGPTNGRGRPISPHRGPAPMRGRSASPSTLRGGPRDRSSSPSARLGTSPSGQRPRSLSPSRGLQQSRNEYANRPRSLSPSRGLQPSRGGMEARPNGDDPQDRRGNFAHGGKRGRFAESSRRLRKSRFGKVVGRSMRQIAPPEKCNFWKVLSYVIPIILLIASSIGLIITTGNASKFTPQVIKDIIPSFDPQKSEDPFAGKTKVPYWNPPNGGKGGLTLTVVNALEDKWQVYFTLAMNDWDLGSPDALTLSSEKASAPDGQCTPITGKLKVCNGNYGQTNWRGINNGVVDGNGYLVASTSKMNDYYLQYDPAPTWQYTMCHEMGHGFGCPHTDENFTNPDLGNCLDYTDNYDYNKHPAAMNWNYLVGLYGVIGGRRMRQRRTVPSKAQEIPATVLSEAKHLLRKLESDHLDAHKHGWKLLHRTKFGEDHLVHLQAGYKLYVHMLLVHSRTTNQTRRDRH